jgi:hypothetical protein
MLYIIDIMTINLSKLKKYNLYMNYGETPLAKIYYSSEMLYLYNIKTKKIVWKHKYNELWPGIDNALKVYGPAYKFNKNGNTCLANVGKNIFLYNSRRCSSV